VIFIRILISSFLPGSAFIRVSKKDKKTGTLKHFSVNACLMPVLATDGCHVTTVEGIGTVKGDNLHPIQKAMTEMHGSQCGKSHKRIFIDFWHFLGLTFLIALRLLYARDYLLHLCVVCQ
jgi:hypothetical protein